MTHETSSYEYCHSHKHVKVKESMSLLNPVISSKLLVDNLNRHIFESYLPKNVVEVLESGLLHVAGVN